MVDTLIANLTPYCFYCAICNGYVEGHNLVDNRCVPFSNGEPVGENEQSDGFKAVCLPCYVSWESTSDSAKEQLSNDYKT